MFCVAGLDFAALKIHVVRTESFFGRCEILVMVAVGGDAPVVEPAEIEIREFLGVHSGVSVVA